MLASTGERRYAHFISVLQSEADAAIAFPDGWWTGAEGDWWSSYYQWWWGGGANAVRGYLSYMQLQHLPSRAPNTTSTEQAMVAGDGAAAAIIREAIDNDTPGFRGGYISINAVRDICEGDDVRVPSGQFLARQLEAMGYRHAVRVRTTAAERMLFQMARSRTRIYYDGSDPKLRDDMDPTQIAALYDAAQRRDGNAPEPSNVVKMPGVI